MQKKWFLVRLSAATGLLFFLLFLPARAEAWTYITTRSAEVIPSLIRLSPRFTTVWCGYENGDTFSESRMGVEFGLTPINMVTTLFTCELTGSLEPFSLTGTEPELTGFQIPGYTVQLVPGIQFFPTPQSIVAFCGVLGINRREEFPAQPSLDTEASPLVYFSGGGGVSASYFLGEEGAKGALALKVLYTTLLGVSESGSAKVANFQEIGTGLKTLQELSVTLGYSFFL